VRRSPQPPDLRLLRDHRTVLERDIDALEPAALHWRPRPEALSIAALLLHIGAVEYVAMSAVAAAQCGGDGFDRALWPALRHGFERNLGLPPAPREPLSHYSGLLTRVRHESEAVLEEPWQQMDVERAQRELLDVLEPGPRQGVNAPLELPVAVVGEGDQQLVASALVAHEEYHRGQITLMKFLR
jgi:hypothetical protein